MILTAKSIPPTLGAVAQLCCSLMLAILGFWVLGAQLHRADALRSDALTVRHRGAPQKHLNINRVVQLQFISGFTLIQPGNILVG